GSGGTCVEIPLWAPYFFCVSWWTVSLAFCEICHAARPARLTMGPSSTPCREGSGAYRNGDGSRSKKLSATVLFAPQCLKVKLNQILSHLMGPPSDGLKSQTFLITPTFVSRLFALNVVSPARLARRLSAAHPPSA